jgi:hypothetical protein
MAAKLRAPTVKFEEMTYSSRRRKKLGKNIYEDFNYGVFINIPTI